MKFLFLINIYFECILFFIVVFLFFYVLNVIYGIVELIIDGVVIWCLLIIKDLVWEFELGYYRLLVDWIL